MGFNFKEFPAKQNRTYNKKQIFQHYCKNRSIPIRKVKKEINYLNQTVILDALDHVKYSYEEDNQSFETLSRKNTLNNTLENDSFKINLMTEDESKDCSSTFTFGSFDNWLNLGHDEKNRDYAES